MTRVTSNMLYNNNLYNVFQNNKGMLQSHQEISTGRKVNKPSDDPYGTPTLLRLRTDEANNEQYMSNIEDATSRLNFADSALANMTTQISRLKEIAVAQSTGTASSETRSISAVEVEQIINQIISLGNSSRNGQYLFSGKDVTTQPFDTTAANAAYTGSSEEGTVEFFTGQTLAVALDGSELMAASLNPDITTATTLASLNSGSGVAASSIDITDRAGNSATVDLSGATTVNDVITAIGAAGLNVTAAINSSGTGITLTDSTTTPVSNLIVTESGSTTAADLGLLSSRASSTLVGLDLDPTVTTATTVANLNSGAGLTLGSISISNGGTTDTVDLSSATTVGDIITAINGSSANVTASINSAGNALKVDSNSATTVAVVTEVGTGTTASALGVGGGKNLIRGAYLLKDALEKNDADAISASIDILDRATENVVTTRSEVGAKVNRLESASDMLINLNDDIASAKAEIEDADMYESISNLQRYQNAYQASLQSSAMIMRTSLLDYIR